MRDGVSNRSRLRLDSCLHLHYVPRRAEDRHALPFGFMKPLFEILSEDDELLVVNKPAGLVCHPTKGDAYSSLISRVRLHLGPDSQPQLVNRLDRETSGVVLVAKDPTTARQLRRIWETGSVTKHYLAVVHGHVAEESGVISAPLG